MTQNRLIRLAKPPDAIVTVTIRSLVQDDVEQIDALWQGILRELQQPDSSWDWAYKLRLALSERRYEADVIEFEDLVQGVILIVTQ